MNIEALEKMIDAGRDGALLRLTLARLLAAEGRGAEASTHLEAAVRMDPAYTAAWKELGRTRLELGETAAAAEAWRQGMDVAAANGDKQAEREMGVFLRRLSRGG